MSKEYSVYKKFKPSDFSVVPFNAKKQYKFNSASAAANKVNYFSTRYTSESISLYTSSSTEVYELPQDTINAVKYFQLDHLYYRNFKRSLSYRFGFEHYLNQKRELYKKANIISIPAGHYGHSIEKGSFKVIDTVMDVNIIDDSKGNLIVEGTDVNNYNIDIDDNIFKLGPVKGFKKYDLGVYDGYIRINGYQEMPFYRRGKPIPNPPSHYTTPEYGDEFDDSYHFNLIKYKNVAFSSKELNKNNVKSGSFPSVVFNGSTSEIFVANDDKFNFNSKDDFTISFWVNVNAQGRFFDKNYLISKSTTQTFIPSITTTKTGTPQKINVSGALQPQELDAGPRHPFEIYVEDSGADNEPHLFFTRANDNATRLISASFTTGSTLQHVTCRYSNSEMKIFINGVASGTSGSGDLGITQNNANLYIGNKGGKSNYLAGSLSNINIYNKSLTNAQILNHYSSSNSSPYVGNIFYSHGIATITHPHYKSFLSGPGVAPGNSVIDNIKYQGNHLIYENEYQCTIEEQEYNSTYNISARTNKSSNDTTLADFATGSLFKPYITTIGLYNEDRELLVVGKLAQPLRTSDETDTTIVLRWDT